jgi:hypothetical protein
MGVSVEAIEALLARGRRTSRRQARSVGSRSAAAQAHQWFFDDDRQWPFAFRNICDLLGLDAQALRGRVLGELKERRREARPRSTPPTRPPKGRR